MKSIALLLVAFCVVAARGEQPNWRQLVFGDEERAEAVRSATRVDACMLKMKDPSHGRNLSARSFVEGRYRTMSEPMVALIAERLLDPSCYKWDVALACVPKWDARVRFHQGDRRIEIDFCFSCSLIQVREHGGPVGGGYFLKGSDVIYRVLAMEFPNDRAIRYHKKRRENEELMHLMIQADEALDRRRCGEPGATDNPGGAQRFREDH